MEKTLLYFRNGSIILNEKWLLDSSIRSIAITKKSRKDFTCVFGCKIVSESSYLRVDLRDGVDGSILELAFCEQHKQLIDSHPKFNGSYENIESDDIAQQIFKYIRQV